MTLTLHRLVANLTTMSVKEIEVAIQQLTPKERSELVSLLVEQHHDDWDRQIEDDLEAGRLDKWMADMRKEYDAGLAEPL